MRAAQHYHSIIGRRWQQELRNSSKNTPFIPTGAFPAYFPRTFCSGTSESMPETTLPPKISEVFKRWRDALTSEISPLKERVLQDGISAITLTLPIVELTHNSFMLSKNQV
jgi:hypothetical protein